MIFNGTSAEAKGQPSEGTDTLMISQTPAFSLRNMILSREKAGLSVRWRAEDNGWQSTHGRGHHLRRSHSVSGWTTAASFPASPAGLQAPQRHLFHVDRITCNR